MVDNRDEAIGDYGDMDLNLHGVLRHPPELLDFQVLLQPLEEQLHQPTVFVEFGHTACRYPVRVCQVREYPLFFRIVVFHHAKRLTVEFLRSASGQGYPAVLQDVVRKFFLCLDDFVLHVRLGPNDKETAQGINQRKTPEIIVGPVKYVVGADFVRDGIHGLHVVHLGFRNQHE